MPIVLADDPLPTQFTLPPTTIAEVIAVLEWQSKIPDWFEMRDFQYHMIHRWYLTRMKESPEFRELNEYQLNQSPTLVMDDGGLFVLFEDSRVPVKS